MSIITIKVPDIGDFEQVEVIEVLVAAGDTVNLEDSLITVESDKASMEIPSPYAGIVKSVLIQVGDHVSEGGNIIEMEVAGLTSEKQALKEQTLEEQASKKEASKNQESSVKVEENTAKTIETENKGKQANSYNGKIDLQTEVLVLGAGPGGYTAAFRAADLGKKVILVEKFENLGGVCLNVGCIPSKALLHVAEVMEEAKEFSQLGVIFNQPEVNTEQLRQHKNTVVGKLTSGLKQLAKQRKVNVINGYGKFLSSHTLIVTATDGSTQVIEFENCIISVGSSVLKIPSAPWDDKRVWDSTDALEIKTIPKRLLIVGAGIIGLEMATVYHALGSKITIVGPKILPGVDRDLLRSFERTLKKRYENIFTKTRLTAITASDEGLICQFNGENAPEQDTFDNVLIAIGRTPNGKLIDAEKAGVSVDDNGFIKVDSQMKTNVAHIFAIGDVVGQPMLAHKATHEAKIAAEVIAGFKRHFDARTIPSVAYTSPEVAWAGQTEEELKAGGIEYEKGVFPWAASGRALSMGAEMGMTKVLYDKNTQQMLGAGIVGKNAGELIAEASLAIEMGAEIEDVALTIHPHPTLSETINFATEVAEGSCTDIFAPKK